MAKAEKIIETQIINALRAIGNYVKKIHSGSVMKSYTRNDGVTRNYRVKLAEIGTSDLIVGFPKGWGIIEVKSNEAEVRKWKKQKDLRSQLQYREQELARNSGGFTLIVCSLDQALKELFELGIINQSTFDQFNL